MPVIAPYLVRARNISVNSENRIHDEEGARRLGFAHGLVSGVTVYSYLMRPLLERFGEAALTGTSSRAAFFAPVYDGDALRIGVAPGEAGSLAAPLKAQAFGEGGEAVAVLEIEKPARLPEPGALPDYHPREPEAERPAFDWGAVVPGRAFHGFAWKPTAEENRRWCESVDGGLPLFRGADRPPLHPGWVLQQANNTLTREFRMNPWIHVSSRILMREPLRAGDAVEVRAVPIDRWEKGGNRYTRLHVALAVNGRAALEIEHKAILQVAPRQSAATGT
jgi:hypothetical protein